MHLFVTSSGSDTFDCEYCSSRCH